MSLELPVLPIRIPHAVKTVIEQLAAREKVTPGTYSRQRLELTLLRGIVKRQWREHGFEEVVRRLCPELLSPVCHTGDDTTNGNGTARATKVSKVSARG